MVTAHEVAAFLNALLSVPGFPDYPAALNGLQLEHAGPVHRIATAVDFSQRTVDACIAAEANMLILHHGMFWGGAQHLTGPAYRRLHRLMMHDVAVYAAHLPLDAHLRVGNCVLLASALGLEPGGRFHTFQGMPIGVTGHADLPTREVLTRAQAFAEAGGGTARASALHGRERTRRWAIVTGAGADSASVREAALVGIDTLIVGEGPHHTTVDAPECGVTIIYAGHYATETLGVRALASELQSHFRLPAEFLFLPTGS